MEHTSSAVGANGASARSTVRTSATSLAGTVDPGHTPDTERTAPRWWPDLSKDIRDPEFWGLCALAAMLMLFT